MTLLAPFEGEPPLTGIEMHPASNAVHGRLRWSDGHTDEIRLSFGDERGQGAVSWKGWRSGTPIGEETSE